MKHLLYYWFKEKQISLEELINIEFLVTKHAIENGQKLFKVFNSIDIEGNEEMFIYGKN